MDVHIHPCPRLAGAVDPPSSKNYTTRYLLASCLARGQSQVLRPAVSEDAEAMIQCARTLGAAIETLDPAGRPIEFSIANTAAIASVTVRGFGNAPVLTLPDGTPDPDPRNPETAVNPHNAGAVLRMLLGIGALLPAVEFTTDHPESLGRRPNRDLVEALRHIGVELSARTENGELPIRLRGGMERIGPALDALARSAPDGCPRIPVSGAVSSQFVSAMLFLAPLLGRPVEIAVTHGLRSRPLVETTLEVLREAGIEVQSEESCLRHRFQQTAGYMPRAWHVHGDWPGSAALLVAAAVVPGSSIVIERLYEDLQGERLTLNLLGEMGCATRRDADPDQGIPFVALQAPDAPGGLKAAVIDGDRCTDAVPALYAAAALARGKTRIFGIRNLQFKECDRIRLPLEQLRRLYATLPAFQHPDGSRNAEALRRAVSWWPEDDPDEVHIVGSPEGFEGGIETNGCGDHRVIMMLSILGLRCRRGLTIRGAHDVAKSYPRWFDDLAALGVELDRRG